jgi:uncharacterized protein YjbI with pentapeptide repeats
MPESGTARTIHGLRITLPGDEPADELTEVTRLPRAGELLTEVRVTGETWCRASLDGFKLSRCWLKGADLTSTTVAKVELERCVFAGCTMIGAQWVGGITLKNVIFENCRFDYATLANVRATGPVAFAGCSLAETRLDHCVLRTAVFDSCKLAGLSLEHCDLRGADLRNNDLAGLATPTALRGAVLSESQLPAFLDGLVAELSIALKPEPSIRGSS